MSRISGDSNSGVWEASLNTTLLPDGQQKVTVTATDSANQQSSPFVTVNVKNSAQPVLHVNRIDVVLSQKGGAPRAQARCDITIVDAFNVPAAGAVINGHWASAANDTFSITTDSAGLASDYSNSATASSGATFTCVVDQVSKPGWQYNPSANLETADSVTIP